VYVSRDRGARWESLSALLPTVAVMDLTVHARERELVIGTYGRGAWVLDLDPIRDRSAHPTGLFLYPIRPVNADPFPWETVPGSRRGRRAVRMQLTSATAGTATITVTDVSGRELRRTEAPVTIGLNTLFWDLQVQGPGGRLGDAPTGTYSIEVQLGNERARRVAVVWPEGGPSTKSP
jgi:hypothetical protein